MERMLTLFRRHSATCAHRDKGRAFLKCSCPCWLDGNLHGRRVLQSLDTRNLTVADRHAKLSATLKKQAEDARRLAQAAIGQLERSQAQTDRLIVISERLFTELERLKSVEEKCTQKGQPK